MPEQTPEATRSAMVRAAASELLAHGYAGSSLARIAGRLGLTKGALAYHFPTKSTLLAAVVDEASDVLAASYASAEAAFPNQSSRICVAHMTAFGAALSTSVEGAAAVALLADPSSPEAVLGPLLREWHHLVSTCFTQAVDAENVVLKVPAQQAAEFFISSQIGTVVTARYLADFATDRGGLQFTKLTLQSLGFTDTDEIIADVMGAHKAGKIDVPQQAHHIYSLLRSARSGEDA